MGVFYVDCRVINIAERDKSAQIQELIVDTGSEFTWLPADVLAGIGIMVEKPAQKFTMANGETIVRDIGYAILSVDGFQGVDEVVFAQDGDLRLLGSHTLEGFGAVVDARKKQLVAAGPFLAALGSATFNCATIGCK